MDRFNASTMPPTSQPTLAPQGQSRVVGASQGLEQVYSLPTSFTLTRGIFNVWNAVSGVFAGISAPSYTFAHYCARQAGQSRDINRPLTWWHRPIPKSDLFATEFLAQIRQEAQKCQIGDVPFVLNLVHQDNVHLRVEAKALLFMCPGEIERIVAYVRSLEHSTGQIPNDLQDSLLALGLPYFAGFENITLIPILDQISNLPALLAISTLVDNIETLRQLSNVSQQKAWLDCFIPGLSTQWQNKPVLKALLIYLNLPELANYVHPEPFSEDEIEKIVSLFRNWELLEKLEASRPCTTTMTHASMQLAYRAAIDGSKTLIPALLQTPEDSRQDIELNVAVQDYIRLFEKLELRFNEVDLAHIGDCKYRAKLLFPYLCNVVGPNISVNHHIVYSELRAILGYDRELAHQLQLLAQQDVVRFSSLIKQCRVSEFNQPEFNYEVDSTRKFRVSEEQDLFVGVRALYELKNQEQFLRNTFAFLQNKANCCDKLEFASSVEWIFYSLYKHLLNDYPRDGFNLLFGKACQVSLLQMFHAIHVRAITIHAKISAEQAQEELSHHNIFFSFANIANFIKGYGKETLETLSHTHGEITYQILTHFAQLGANETSVENATDDANKLVRPRLASCTKAFNSFDILSENIFEMLDTRDLINDVSLVDKHFNQMVKHKKQFAKLEPTSRPTSNNSDESWNAWWKHGSSNAMNLHLPPLREIPMAGSTFLSDACIIVATDPLKLAFTGDDGAVHFCRKQVVHGELGEATEIARYARMQFATPAFMLEHQAVFISRDPIIVATWPRDEQAMDFKVTLYEKCPLNETFVVSGVLEGSAAQEVKGKFLEQVAKQSSSIETLGESLLYQGAMRYVDELNHCVIVQKADRHGYFLIDKQDSSARVTDLVGPKFVLPRNYKAKYQNGSYFVTSIYRNEAIGHSTVNYLNMSMSPPVALTANFETRRPREVWEISHDARHLLVECDNPPLNHPMNNRRLSLLHWPEASTAEALGRSTASVADGEVVGPALRPIETTFRVNGSIVEAFMVPGEPNEVFATIRPGYIARWQLSDPTGTQVDHNISTKFFGKVVTHKSIPNFVAMHQGTNDRVFSFWDTRTWPWRQVEVTSNALSKYCAKIVLVPTRQENILGHIIVIGTQFATRFFEIKRDSNNRIYIVENADAEDIDGRDIKIDTIEPGVIHFRSYLTLWRKDLDQPKLPSQQLLRINLDTKSYFQDIACRNRFYLVNDDRNEVYVTAVGRDDARFFSGRFVGSENKIGGAFYVRHPKSGLVQKIEPVGF